MKFNFKHGFTLAEVLITIGIIGIVAALTLPTLIDTSEAIIYKTQFKKAINMLTSAGKMSKAKYGFDYSAAEYSGNGNSVAGDADIIGILRGTIENFDFLGFAHGQYGSKYISVWNKVIYPILSNAAFLIRLQDGTLIAIGTENGGTLTRDCHIEPGEKLNSDWINAHRGCLALIDVNGINPPNKAVSCSDGTETSLTPETPCKVKRDAKYMSDIYPIVFHDSIVEPASNAAIGVFMN